MKIYKTTEASNYLGVSINTLKTLANNNKINSFKTNGEHRRFEKKYEQELAEDIMKILTCYSARYYGARGGRKKKIEVSESNGI